MKTGGLHEGEPNDLARSVQAMAEKISLDNARIRLFCVTGHKQPSQCEDDSGSCYRCSAKLVSTCDCGAALDLWGDYKPPYDRVVRGRDCCRWCRTLAPWAFLYLNRSEVHPAMTAYDKQLLLLAPIYPSLQQYGLTDSEIARTYYATWLDRLRFRGVSIIELTHPSHGKWSFYQDAIKAAHETILATRSLRYRRECEQAKEARRQEREHFKRIGAWLDLSGQQFERQLQALLCECGYDVRHVGGPGDAGADLLLVMEGKTIVIQCKAHAKQIGPAAIRDLYGSLQHHGAAEGWLVSTMGFSLAAQNFAQNKPLKLFTIRDVLEFGT